MSDKSRSNSIQERILAAARSLAKEKPLDQIGLSEVARLAGVSWPTVKRHVGSKEKLRESLVREDPSLTAALPDTRRRLLDAARVVFARSGYEGATLDDVAATANLTKGAVYWHFEGKSELLEALIVDLAESRQKLAERALLSAGRAEPGSALDEFLRVMFGDPHTPDTAQLTIESLAQARSAAVRGRLAQLLSAPNPSALGLGELLRSRGELAPSLEPEDFALLLQAVVLCSDLTLPVEGQARPPTPLAAALRRAALTPARS